MQANQTLPEDPFILYSVVNTKLRDFYPSLEQLCDDMEISKKNLISQLEQVGFHYDRSKNQFS